MVKNDGGQAFPVPPPQWNDNNGWQYATEGMTLRDYIAIKSLELSWERWIVAGPEMLAIEAYKIAEAMISERDRKEDADAGSPKQRPVVD